MEGALKCAIVLGVAHVAMVFAAVPTAVADMAAVATVVAFLVAALAAFGVW